MDKIKKYFKKLLKILSLKELRILPAYMSYSFVLASMPIFTIIVVVASYFSISMDSIISLINNLLPSYASKIVVNAISGESFDLSIAIINIVTFIIGANGMYAVVSASNSLYKVDDSSQIKDRLKSVIILLIIIALLLFLIVVPMLGNKIIEILEYHNLLIKHLDKISVIYNIIRWPLTFLVIFININLIYNIAPSIKIKRGETLLGAFVSTVGWMLFTAVFGYYINYIGRYDLVYGSLSSISILLIWMYILSFILIFGIVVNTMKYNKV